MGEIQRQQDKWKSFLFWVYSYVAHQVRVLKKSLPSQLFLLAVLLILRKLWQQYKQVRKSVEDENDWTKREDMYMIQAALLSSEHCNELGRVEKRTLFVKALDEIFPNGHILSRVLEAAKKTSPEQPILPVFLSEEEKWHVLNTCTNHLSSLFPSTHIFFNEGRRTESYYRSAWYAFTMTCQRSSGKGRFFITPNKPVINDDIGFMRIRIVLVAEEELRSIASGEIQPSERGFFNNRHENRWMVMKNFASLFERQLTAVAGPSALSVRHIDSQWGRNLCGRVYKNHTQFHLDEVEGEDENEASARRADNLRSYDPEENCFLRIHIPFPSKKDARFDKNHDGRTNNVVLYE